MRKICICLFLLLLFSVVSIAVPSSISFQGLLKDSAGDPITGSRTITFNIFPSATGAGSLWVETQTVTIETGLYNVQLGSVAPITSSVFDGSTRYLAISIGGTELLPRVVLLTVPYSYRAEKADTATYADTAGSSGGIPNAVLFNPSFRQTTIEPTAIWVSSSASGADQYSIKYTISAEATGSQACSAILGFANNPSATNASIGIIGATAALSGTNHSGVLGMSFGSGASGVMGQASSTNSFGVYGRANDSSSYGAYGRSNNGVGIGGKGATAGGSFEATSGIGVYAADIGSFGGTGLRVESKSSGGIGIFTVSEGVGIDIQTNAADSYAGSFLGGKGVKINTGSLEAKSGLVITDAFTPTGGADPGGVSGNIQWDENYIYIKTAAGGWKRATLEAF